MTVRKTKLFISILLLTVGTLAPGRAEAGFWTHRDRMVRLDLERGHVEVQIVPDRGGAMTLARDGDHRWVFEGSTADLVGGSYSIVLRNRSPERIKVVVGVDGVNVYRKDPIVGRADQRHRLDPVARGGTPPSWVAGRSHNRAAVCLQSAGVERRPGPNRLADRSRSSSRLP